MAGEHTTVARPYAEAAFARALETDTLDAWSASLSLLAQLVVDKQIASIIDNPQVPKARGAELVNEVGGEHLNQEVRNLVRLLAQNRRLAVLPEISTLFEALKSESESTLDVHVISAYVVTAAQEKLLADALQTKLGRQIRISSEKDPSLIAGVIIRAGDLVIDGSFKGQLGNLASELGI